MNRWIQGILMFDFTLKHIQERVIWQQMHYLEGNWEKEKRLWRMMILGWIIFPFMWDFQILSIFCRYPQPSSTRIPTIYPKELPSFVFSGTIRLDENLKDILKFLTTLEAPPTSSIQDQNDL